MRRLGLILILSLAFSLLLGSCRTYMYRAICYSAGTKIYDGHVDIDRPANPLGLLGWDVYPATEWLRTADGAYIRADCVVQPMRIDGQKPGEE